MSRDGGSHLPLCPSRSSLGRRLLPCPLRARQEERLRVVTVTQRQTTKIPQVTESAGGSTTAPQTSQADSAGSIPVTRSTTKPQVSDSRWSLASCCWSAAD